jgi:hypothetical protein
VGLGLALVKSIAQRHGGRVFCESRSGGGACFVIELPLTQGSGDGFTLKTSAIYQNSLQNPPNGGYPRSV